MAVLVQRLGLSSTGNRATWTFSAWIKRSRTTSGNEFIFSSNGERTGTSYYSSIYFANDTLRYYDYFSGAAQKYLYTNRVFRDLNAWYHIVVRVDTTQATASDRIRFYVNGVQETSFDSSDYPTQNDNSSFVNYAGMDNFVGTQTNNLSGAFLGSMSHVYLCDGQSYAPTVFGSTDSTTGEWKINTSPSITMGTNGFTILKDGNTVTDQSSNSNDFSIGSGTLTKTEDCPSNVFATLNPLSNGLTSGTTLSNGNTTFATPSGGHDFTISTLGMNSGSGKFYCEIKVSSSAAFNMIGISDHCYQGSNQELSEDNYSYGYYSDSGGGSTAGVVRGNGSNVLTGMPNYTTNDIIGIAVDLENHKLYFHKNGTYINSGDPTSGSTGTGAVSINNLNTTPNTDARGQGAYFFGVGDWTTTGAGTYQCNFGNGYFGTTAVSSAGTNASNLGIFEYDVPSGYTALCTKGLNL